MSSILTLKLPTKEAWKLNKLKSILWEKTSTKCLIKLINIFANINENTIDIKTPDLWSWSDVKNISFWYNIDGYWSDMIIEFNDWNWEGYNFRK